MTCPDDNRITVIIGTWNRAELLPHAISSILEQTMEEFELIVADDGSTDDTESVVAGFDDPRVRFVTGPHVGISRNLNRALEQVRCDFVALLDSDDWSYPERLERQLAVLESRPEVGAVGHRLGEVDADGREVVPRHTFAVGDLSAELLRFNPMSNSCAALRMSAVRDVGGYDRSYTCTVDWDMWLRISDRWVVHTLDEVLGVHRMHSGSLSMQREREQIRAGLRTRLATLRRRRTLRGITGLGPAALSYVTPMPLKRARRRLLKQIP